MKYFALLTDDKVLRSVVRATDKDEAIKKFVNMYKNPSITDGCIAIDYKKYKKQIQKK